MTNCNNVDRPRTVLGFNPMRVKSRGSKVLMGLVNTFVEGFLKNGIRGQFSK